MAEPKLVVALEARLNKFEKDLQQAGVIADRQVKSIEDKFAKSNPGSSFFAGLAKGAIAAFSLERAINLVVKSISEMAKIGDVAQRVGITPEQLQEISFALEQNGGSAEQAADGMQKFAGNIAKAMEGEGKLGRFLQENNVALKDRVTGALRPTADLLADVANLIKNTQSPQERLNVATAFFGKSAGPSMALALEKGALGLRDFGAQAQQAGGVIENELIKKAKEVDDKWNAIARTFGTTVKSAIIQLIDASSRLSTLSAIAASLDAGTTSAKQLADAIELARSKDSPVDPSWIKELERLRELQREALRGNFNPVGLPGSTLPGATDTGRKTNTSALAAGGGADNLDAFERAIAAAKKHTEELAAETAAIDLGAAAQARAKLIVDLNTAAVEANRREGKANTAVTAEQTAEINKQADAYENVMKKAEAAKNPLRDFARESSNVTLQLQNAGVAGLRGFEDALIDIGKQTTTVAEAFKKMAAAILEDLARIAIRASITGPLASFLGGGSPLPMRALGGPVSAGSPYMVGERGRELFVPKVAGTILPNNIVKQGIGGANITLATTIDARGSNMTEGHFRQILAEHEVRIKRDVVPIVRDAQSRRML